MDPPRGINNALFAAGSGGSGPRAALCSCRLHCVRLPELLCGGAQAGAKQWLQSVFVVNEGQLAAPVGGHLFIVCGRPFGRLTRPTNWQWAPTGNKWRKLTLDKY